jgi:Concanavalin A-like lectin/glucanases superfamily
LTVPANAAFTLTGDFCVEFWVYSGLLAGGATNPTFINDSAGSNSSIFYETNGSNRGLCLYAAGAARITTATNVLVENQWNHVAIVRSGTTGTNTAAFVNGTRVGTATAFTGTVDFSPPVINKYGPSAAGYLNGYMSNFRIVKGSSVYDPTSSTITVPTAPLTNITNTSLLLNFTNAGIYDATSKNDLETVGNAQISTAQSKSGSSSILLAQSGTNDYITSPDSPLWQLTGDFTIEAWIYPTSLSGTNGNIICSQWPGGTATNQCFQFLVNSTGKVSLVYGIGATNAAVTGTSQSAVTNNWNHVAVSRQGSTVRFFVNGNLDTTTGTVSGALNNSTGMLVVGRINATDLGYFTGYIDDLRITNGVARYTSSFTPESSLPLQ